MFPVLPKLTFNVKGTLEVWKATVFSKLTDNMIEPYIPGMFIYSRMFRNNGNDKGTGLREGYIWYFSWNQL